MVSDENKTRCPVTIFHLIISYAHAVKVFCIFYPMTAQYLFSKRSDNHILGILLVQRRKSPVVLAAVKINKQISYKLQGIIQTDQLGVGHATPCSMTPK